MAFLFLGSKPNLDSCLDYDARLWLGFASVLTLVSLRSNDLYEAAYRCANGSLRNTYFPNDFFGCCGTLLDQPIHLGTTTSLSCTSPMVGSGSVGGELVLDIMISWIYRLAAQFWLSILPSCPLQRLFQSLSSLFLWLHSETTHLIWRCLGWITQSNSSRLTQTLTYLTWSDFQSSLSITFNHDYVPAFRLANVVNL